MPKPIKIAVIWSTHTNDPLYSTHHSFWEETIKDRGDCLMTRFTWENFHQMPLGFDLYLFLDFHPNLFNLDLLNFHPRILYWWDSFHHPYAYVSQVTELFDQSYLAEYQSALHLIEQGFRVKWLPPAFYPKLYRPIKADPLYHYAFVGQLDGVIKRKSLSRADFINKLIQEPGLAGYVGGAMGEVVNLIYNQAQILFDRTIFNNIGTRFFETIGSGKLTLVNTTKGHNRMQHFGIDGIHYVTYDDSYQDFIYKLRYYLERPQEQSQIATQGRDHFLKNHTYHHRLEIILRDFHLI